MTDNLLDGFDDLADQIEDQRKQRLRAVAVSTGGQRPDDAARANDIAARRGLPFGVVADNLQDFHEQDRLDGLDAVGQRAPVVGQFLADPRRMALAGDEAPGLERLSGSLAGTREPEDMGFFHRTIRNLLPISDSAYNSTVGATLDYMGARFQVADAKVFSTAAQSLGRVLSFANTANRVTADLYQREADAAAARGDTDRQDALARAAATYRDPTGAERFASGAQDFTKDLTAQQQALGSQSARPASVRAAIDAPGNSLRYYGGMLADSVPAMLFAMATRNPEAGAAAMGATTGMQTYADRVNEGASDLQALREGAAQGGLEAVGSVIPLSHAFGGGARRFITTPLSEALSEGVTQAAQVDAEDLLQGKQTPTSEKLAQVLDAMIVGGPMGLIEAAGGGGPSHAQQRAFGEQLQQTVASADQAAQLKDITEAAAATKLVERSPADAEALVDASGAGDARVYLPADAVATLFQSSPGVLEEAVGGPEALAEQMATGDVTIPMAKWVSVVSRMPNADEIRRHARLSADGLSEVELEKFSPEGLAQELGVGSESTDAARAASESAAKVQADVYAQLLATQRYTPAQAEAQAKLWGAAFGRIGQMTGQDPLALYKQRMAGVGTGTDTAAAPTRTFMQRGIDALRGLLGRPRVTQDARGQQTIVRDGNAYAQRAGKWLLADEQGQPRDFLTLNQAQAAAEAAGGEVVHDDPIEGQRQTWSVALPDTAAREALSGDIVSLYQSPAGPNAPELDFGDRTDEQLAGEYAALPGTEGGRVIDTDMVRELSPEYRADRSLSPRIHRAASTLTRRLFAQALAGPVAEGREPVVVFTAGGGGSGKSTAIKAVMGSSNADVTLDGTLSNLERARSDVAAALASGRTVEIRYVYRSPQNSVEGAIGRAIRTGRPVPVSVLAEAHANAPKVVRALAEEYTGDGRVSITAINNDGPMGTAFEIPIEEIPDVDQRSAERTFRAALDDARSSGRVGPELYAAFGGGPEAAAPAGAAAEGRVDGDAAGAGSGGPASAGLRGRPQPGRNQRRRNAVADDQNPAAGGVSASGENRGRIDVYPDQRMAISLFQNADLSTFLHESGHFFLEVYRDAAAAENATPQLRADFEALTAWLGVESPDKIGVDQHEQFARGFEAYLAEGRAPSPELQSVFSQFRAWLLGVYRTLTRLNVQLTDEVRGVFDRMLASEAEIEVAQARSGAQPLARTASEAAQLGLTEKQFSDYQRMLAAAAEEARAEVQQKLEQAHRRERERWWKDEAEKVREEVQAEIEAQPAVRARRILSGAAEAAGEPVPAALQGMKLDRAALVADYGASHLKKLGRVYAREGGIHPDEAAALLGFSSGDELVQGLWGVDQVLATIPDEVRRRMHERHGNPMTDGTLPALALEAVHNSKRAQVLDRELAVLAQLAGEPRPSRRELRAVAEDVVARKTDRQIRPNDYLVAERRAAADSARAAAGADYGAALLAKRRQALNAALYAAARRAKDEIASKASDIRKQSEGRARERLGLAGADYLEAMDALTEAFEFRPVSAREVSRRQSLRTWVEARQADDDLTAITDALLARVEAERVTNYQDMTLAELRELHDAVTNIAHLARLKNELLKGKDKREWKEAQAEMAGAIRSALAERAPVPFSDADRTVMQSVGAAYEGLLDWVVRPETVVEWLDGGETGPWHDYLWNQAEAAQQLRIDYRNKVGGMLTDMAAAMTSAQRADLQRKVYIQGLGRSVSRNTIVALALNMGNAGNRDKLMRGGYLADGRTIQFTPATVAEMLGHLTPADGQMIQRIWDAVDSLWPDIEAQQKRLSGVAPERIEPTPLIFTGAGGAQISLRGGYYPAVYDPRASRGGTQQARAAEERVMGGTFSRAMTSKGHTKERTDYAAPMLLDYHAVLSRHLNDVITDLSHRGYVKQALRVLEDGELKGLIIERLSEGAYHSLYGSVKNSVAGASIAEPGSKMAEKLADGVLTNTAVAALGFRIPLVMANAVVAPIQAAARVDPKYLATGYTAYYRNPAAATRAIHDLSPFMLERADSLDSTYQQVLGKLTGKKGMRAAAMKMAMEVHRWVVPISERAIWLGRYQQALAEGAGPADAVLLADKSIRQTQQAGAPKDLSAAERDPRYKWVRMFIGPMVIMNNRLQESGMRGLYLGRVQSPARALGTWLSAAVLSNAVFELMMGRGPGGGDDDDDADAADWAAWLARKSLLFPFQTFPLLRDVASAVDAAMEGKQQSSRPNPIVDAGVALAKFGQAAWKEGHDWFAEDDEVDAEKLIKTGVRAAGPVTGLPSNQMLTTGEYLYDVGTGQYTPDNPAEAAAYLMYRRPRDKQ
ncbi:MULTISPECIES: zeta toxin family protein [unclassified Xanthomonas]|uniref:zeta toxin family protein n=1 Tax=unclassified Xanthomonas TaxID=2643310 RepID=UPI002A7EB6CF|nr:MULTISPECIES: zeta toxin family protein [unclassified Xanthomonas]MDY4297511.1 zeta toxin family protein [Xanthomonas sp. LF02-5]MDY4359305.1 zeta toxin family protein [Xanthomonas sp. LF04-12]